MKTYMDANRANLSEKKDLCHLSFTWERNTASESRTDMDEKVLEALRPHPNLQTLTISGFSGRCFPIWMTDSVLEKVIRIEIMNLPELGKLPHLEFLRLENVGVEYIIEDEDAVDTSPMFPNSTSIDVAILLCELEELKNLNNLRKYLIGALEVHENLQSLQISLYGGTKLPHWIMKLTNLSKLSLEDCQNCTNLPSLGKLPSLVTLHLEGMKSVNFLGLEFLGVHVEDDNNMIAFPNLKTLKISNMESWEEWELNSIDENLKIMPRLRCLKISRCSKLKALPTLLLQMSMLRKLHIDNCTLLQEQYNRETGEKWSKISHISKVRVSCNV